MRNVCSIARREILAFFASPIAYFVITGFVLLAGYFFFNLLGIFNLLVMRYKAMAAYRGPGMTAPNLNQWVVEPFFHTLLVILVFLIPLLTMRVLAEERRRGTFELLITSPVSVAEIILGKFCGVAFVVILMMVLIFCFPLLLIAFGSPGPEAWPVVSGLGAILLCALAFTSVAMAVSAFTENQIVAAVSGMVVLLLLYVIHAPAESLGATGAALLEYLSPVMQTRDMLRGVVTTEALLYFVSMIVFGLFLSQRALDALRWR